MSKPRDDRQDDLFRPSLEAIIDPGHPLVRLGREIDWGFLDARFGSVCAAGPGQPPLPTRLVAGLLILKHLHDLSDEALCARWLENPYYQHFCGEKSFRHRLPFDRSSLSRWRQRLGEEQLAALIQESLSVAHRTGALATKDLERVAVDTTVQPKAVAFPTDARLMHAAIVWLGRLAKRHGVPLRQSYLRVAKRAALMAGRYAHAKQFKRHERMLRFLRTRLGRLIRDIERKTGDDKALRDAFAVPVSRADRVRRQRQRQRGWKLYSLHAPEVECIAKGKARARLRVRMQGLYRHAGDQAEGRPVRPPRPGAARQSLRRPHPGSRRRRHRGPHRRRGPPHPCGQRLSRPQPSRRFRVWITGQVRRVTTTIGREMRRRAAIEPTIGHLKHGHRMERNYLKGRDGDRANAVLAAAGYNFRLLVRWFEALLRALFQALLKAAATPQYT